MFDDAQQYIESILKKTISPEQQQQKKRQLLRKKYDILLTKIQYNDLILPINQRKYDYSNEGIKPLCYFFKYLAKKPLASGKDNGFKLKLWIPDTVIVNDEDLPPMWIFSNEKGEVVRTDTFIPKNVSTKLGNYASPDELVAVIKKPKFNDDNELCGNDIKLLSKRELTNAIQQIFTNKAEFTVIQKFIKSNGPKAFICRTCWRREKNPYTWIITNRENFFSSKEISENQKYITNVNVMNSCTIISTCRGKQVEETALYLQNLDKYFTYYLDIYFKEIIGDFIKDESGTWWLVNIKGFLVEYGSLQANTKIITQYGEEGYQNMQQIKRSKKQEILGDQYMNVKVCKYCEQYCPREELNHKMTLKQIIMTDRHLMLRGKNYEWLFRSDIKDIDPSLLYLEHRVCKLCYRLYKEVERIMNLELNFAQKCGIPATESSKYLMINGSKSEQILQTLENWSLDKALQLEELQAKNKKLNIKNLQSYRFMVLINSISEIPEIDSSKSYFIEYSIFNQKARYKLDFNVSKNFLIMNKMKIFYFFVTNRKSVLDFINLQQSLKIDLIEDNSRIGYVEFELKDFLSDIVYQKEYFKYMNGKNISPALSYGTNIQIGLKKSQSLEHLKKNLNFKLLDQWHFSEFKNVLLLSSNYYMSEPLPQEWIEVINDKKDNLAYNIENKELKHLSSLSKQFNKTTQSFKLSTKDLLNYKYEEDIKQKSKQTQSYSKEQLILKEIKDYTKNEFYK